MGGRAVEGTGLENRQARKGLVGSNPTPSATQRASRLLWQAIIPKTSARSFGTNEIGADVGGPDFTSMIAVARRQKRH
jgi:hypothetical protein